MEPGSVVGVSFFVTIVRAFPVSNPSIVRYQDDANGLYYHYPTSIYVSTVGVAIRQSEARIQDAQLSSPTSATSGSEHGGDVLTLSQSSFVRNQGYSSMVPPDRPGSIPPAPSAPPDSFGEYPEYNPSYRQSISIKDNKTTAPSAPPLVANRDRRSSKNTAVVIACRPWCVGFDISNRTLTQISFNHNPPQSSTLERDLIIFRLPLMNPGFVD
jgi:hypothetical protein